MIKTFDDHGRFILVIEPVDDEAKLLIKKIKQICGIENQEDKSFKGLADIPHVPSPEKPAFKPVSEDEISPGLKAYVDACAKIRKGDVTPEEKDELLKKIKSFADNLKKTVPTSKNLHYIVENMEKVFSQKIKDRVLSEIGLSYEDLVKSDDSVLTEAYKKAVA